MPRTRPARTVKRTVTIKVTKIPKPLGQAVPTGSNTLPSRPTNGKIPGVKRIYYG